MKARAGKDLHPEMAALVHRRRTLGIPIQDVAYLLRVAPATVWSWEGGRRQLNLWQASAYAAAVGAVLVALRADDQTRLPTAPTP